MEHKVQLCERADNIPAFFTRGSLLDILSLDFLISFLKFDMGNVKHNTVQTLILIKHKIVNIIFYMLKNSHEQEPLFPLCYQLIYAYEQDEHYQ